MFMGFLGLYNDESRKKFIETKTNELEGTDELKRLMEQYPKDIKSAKDVAYDKLSDQLTNKSKEILRKFRDGKKKQLKANDFATISVEPIADENQLMSMVRNDEFSRAYARVSYNEESFDIYVHAIARSYYGIDFEFFAMTPTNGQKLSTWSKFKEVLEMNIQELKNFAEDKRRFSKVGSRNWAAKRLIDRQQFNSADMEFLNRLHSIV
jgi:hypothetical protein